MEKEDAFARSMLVNVGGFGSVFRSLSSASLVGGDRWLMIFHGARGAILHDISTCKKAVSFD